MSDSERGGPRWAARLAALCVELRGAAGESARNAEWEEAWVLLNAGLCRYLRVHASRVGPIPPEDVQDLAAEKSLELLGRAVSGTWDTAGRSPAELAGYLSTVARNEVLDWRGRADRFVPLPDGPPGGGDPAEEGHDAHRLAGTAAADPGDSPDLGVERREFASALLECAEKLESRSRRVWFFRTFYDMRSREIAAHPSMGIKTAHVDVVFSRSRQWISKCMHQKGHTLDSIPQGVFFDLWQAFRGGYESD